MTDAAHADVGDLATGLRSTFPARDDAPLALQLLQLLARGRPVSATALADASGRDREAAAKTLNAWPNVERDNTGWVVGFSGLTLKATPHRFTVSDRQLHTWCAWDTLFLPALLDQPATVRSRCPVTGTDVELDVAPDAVKRAQPAQLFVSFPPLTATDTADITASFCCHVHFLAGAGAAGKWEEAHPDGQVLDVHAAYELGRQTVEPLLEVARDRAQEPV